MSESELDQLENEIPALAVEALTNASRRALESGRTVVVLEGTTLVRIGPEGTTILKELPPREKVLGRKKRATS